jgi:hypothetical protein
MRSIMRSAMRRQIVAAVLTALVTALPAAAQPPGGTAEKKTAWTQPKTPWGDPDLRGMWPNGDMTGVPLQRPLQFGERAVLTDEEFAQRQEQIKRMFPGFVLGAWGEAGQAQRQASLIVDPPNGQLPALTAEGQRRSATLHSTWQDIYWDSVEDFDIWDRCITRGLPPSMMPMQYNNGIEIHQAPGYVVIRLEMIHEARIVPVDKRPPLSPAIRQWMGESRGHWEGNTLVVETTNFNGKTIATNVGTTGSPPGNNIPVSTSMRMIERFTRVDNDTINYEVTVDDPVVFTSKWKVSYPLHRDPKYVIYEYACHEGNTAIPNYISASRAERAAQEAAK